MKGPLKGNDYLRVLFFLIAAGAVLLLVLTTP
jgi:hypothetical protein